VLQRIRLDDFTMESLGPKVVLELLQEANFITLIQGTTWSVNEAWDRNTIAE